jgi:glycerol-3-phosphate dehydrogenase
MSLPGGDIIGGNLDDFISELCFSYSWLPETLAQRYAHVYGSLCHTFLKPLERPEELGRDFGHGLHQVEVDYLADNEWARCADDILWRRTRLGLHFTEDQTQALEQYLGMRKNQPPGSS